MTLQEQVKEQVKAAMKAKDTVRLTTLRGLVSSFQNEAITLGGTPQTALSDEQVLAVIRREAKRRKDSISQYTEGGREDLAAQEQAELTVLEEFLPQMMSHEDIAPVVEAKKVELGITDKSGMGQLMGAVMKELAGKADGGDVKAAVEASLNI